MTKRESFWGKIIVILIVIIFEVCVFASLDFKLPHAAPADYGETW